MTETEKQSIFYDGYNAYLKGVPVWQNPHNDGTNYDEWKQWFDGFVFAYSTHEGSKTK